jgi:hypothetical protein
LEQPTEKATVHEGLYVSCEGNSSVPLSELKLRPPSDSIQMWVGVTSEEGVAPAAFLENGKFLVPIESPHGCGELKTRLKVAPN